MYWQANHAWKLDEEVIQPYITLACEIIDFVNISTNIILQISDRMDLDSKRRKVKCVRMTKFATIVSGNNISKFYLNSRWI
jgi:hypothetical protein